MFSPYRITPALDAGAYKTYQIRQPKSTHFRRATCEEVDCQAQAHGWRTEIDDSTELGQKQVHYIRKLSKRRFTEDFTPGGLRVFTFEAGQTCFAEHMVSVERPALFAIRGGDYRTPSQGRQVPGEQWLEDFAEHQARLAEQIEKG